VRYGFVFPGGDPVAAADLAAEAEVAGWDGFFCWEGIWAVDAWVSLAAAAVRTSTIRLGTMLTPLPRRLPWDLASQSATLDNLSGGRVILSVGLGAPEDRFWIFEDDPGRRVRAERLDEGLAMVSAMWLGQPFSFEGKHFRAKHTDQMIPPAAQQRPRIPVWVVGLWPVPRSMRRVARWDGWLPNIAANGGAGPARPEVLAEGVAWLRTERERLGLSMAGFDVVVEGSADDLALVPAYQEAGATWWLEADWGIETDMVDACRERLRAGPPAA
jgi:alkanesulfonate monooxygenase SsuD/methylene tetrahydromethanopterin reductase-like flavin-dependent oxidoreductase (luciferase family)